MSKTRQSEMKPRPGSATAEGSPCSGMLGVEGAGGTGKARSPMASRHTEALRPSFSLLSPAVPDLSGCPCP